ncbi:MULTISPECIES: PRC-barrel domain-containing protein [Paenibacillus]|uniref:Subunit H of photosystem reaction center n=1 Tax=Paenibacillus naphthalenovorans TaxID=162209 RepID=A0A0U2IMQ6_9BACL|nr:MULTISPECIES: PRC-barrel domain-containing protein [Paenibacillus]ALS23163.1 subunit H of photosystem reaction center [Paenibacillus naphthalenovorans]NTZ17233.1 photosystem reaction center subunit H [Paenibacillus sp. JMULE4]GCL71704.1 photosystem reaction center subunit H [Paenibacillus naphthalenovorans]SDI13755.1 Uncharacterized protein YrrD, contains PRC-barrel domain [Paenibacillus naphthalenovorans]
MKKARDVIGLPIICVETGKQVGHTKDLLMDEGWQVEALLLEARHWFSDMTCIASADVVALGDDAVTIRSEEAVRSIEADKVFRTLLFGDSKLKGLPVITVNGQQLGMVEDVYLEPVVGIKVIGYELTEGFISDLKEGRRWLPMPDSVKIGKDALIVPVQASDTLEEIFVPKEE